MDEKKKELVVERDTQGYVSAASIVSFESSNFKQIVYNSGKGGTVDITFKSGAVYRYHGIPPALWDYVERQTKKNKTTLGKELYNELVCKPDIYPYRKIS